ncbi:hypothetical protein M408DRAFT_325985 [Serendipita vermifera MAFF 305830]|uniref:Uncharacterized protein n=1 Tax=Serendipita vermifera MAFF 305830 TaxID=933852 RepID=A0A0C3B8Q1_SERVB|nr:hypothetical protein M408DRAFT_325985 [Serendipita vermifera MAFF 305830]
MKLNQISTYMPYTAQFQLLKRISLELADRKTTDTIRSIISQAYADIEMQGHIVIRDPSTHIRRLEQVKVLQWGLMELDKLKPGIYKPTEGDATIQQDAHDFQMAVDQAIPVNQTTDEVIIYDMLDPMCPGRQPPKVLGLSKCKEICGYLKAEGIANQPELWSRHQNLHALTPEGRSWTFVKREEDIRGKFVEFINLARRFTSYIVVLLHQDQRDIARPIEIPFPGDPCCSRACRRLGQHFQELLQPRRIQRAVTINEKQDVYDSIFDTGLFDVRSNDLCIYCG